MATETVKTGGYLGPYRLRRALIDPRSTRTLVSEDFVNKHSIPMQVGSPIRIELANGQIEVPVGELIKPQRIEIARISTTLNLPVVQSRGVYDLLLGRNWLRVLGKSGDYGTRTTYRISGNGRSVTLRNTRDGCIPIQIETNGIALKADQDECKHLEMRTGPPRQVNQRIPATIHGRTKQSVRRVLPLRKEVFIQSTLERMTYLWQNQ